MSEILTLLGYEYWNDILHLLVYSDKTQSMLYIPKDGEHESYFIVSEGDASRFTSKKRRGYKGMETIEKFVAMRGAFQNMKAIVSEGPNDVPSLRRGMSNYWEGHINYHECYVYDRQIVFGHPVIWENGFPRLPFKYRGDLEEFIENVLGSDFPRIKRCALDIEVRVVKGKYPNPETAENPIVAVSIVGSDGKSHLLLSSSENISLGSIEYFAKEADMISRVFQVAEDYPVILTKNGDMFDLPYLENRSKKLGIKDIPVHYKAKFMGWRHKVHIDLERFFGNGTVKREIFKDKYNNNSLGELAIKLLNKIKLPSPDFEKDSPDKIGFYCLNDSELTLELSSFDDDYVMRLIILLCRVSNMDIETLTRRRISSWIRSYFQFFHRLQNYLIPNTNDMKRYKVLENKLLRRAKELGAKSSYRGAIILDPKKLGTVGYHFDCRAGDYGSLYPSSVSKYNICYSTIACSHPECKNNLVPELGFHICTKRRGILPTIFGSIKDLRLRKYKPKMRSLESELEKMKSYNAPSTKEIEIELAWYRAIVDALRILINAGYGVFGDDDLEDLFCYPVPAAIAAYARNAFTIAQVEAEKIGAIVIGGHTDSLYLKNISEENMIKLSEIISEKLDIDFEIQGHYPFVSVWRKGNYLTVDDHGNVKVKGLMGKKRHVPPFIKSRFEDLKRIISDIRDERTRVDANIAIVGLVRQSKKMIDQEEIPLEELSWSIDLGKDVDKGTGQIYEAARLLKKELYPDLTKGNTILLIKTVGDYTAKPVELIKDYSEVNKDKYLELMGSIFNQVLEPMGIDTDELLERKKEPKKKRSKKAKESEEEDEEIEIEEESEEPVEEPEVGGSEEVEEKPKIKEEIKLSEEKKESEKSSQISLNKWLGERK